MESQGNEDFEDKKLYGYEWFKSLGSPRYFLAPMVNACDLSFRILCKKHNTDVLYTPMITANIFVKSEIYRKKMFKTYVNDGPLIVQLCGDNPDDFLEASKLLLKMEDDFLIEGLIKSRNIVAIGINLGCPQKFAMEEHFGSFLMEEPELIEQIVSKLSRDRNIRVPVTCKIRIFPNFNDTESYVKMLVRAGASMIVVHGRLREMKGRGDCDVEAVKKIKKIVKEVPIILNGISNRIESQKDIDKFLFESGCDGVMIAKSLLFHPDIFEYQKEELEEEEKESTLPRRHFEICQEYLDIVQEISEKDIHFQPPIMKRHIFEPLGPEFERNPILKEVIHRYVVTPDLAKKALKELKFRVLNNLHETKTRQPQFPKEDNNYNNNNEREFCEDFTEDLREMFFHLKECFQKNIKAKKLFSRKEKKKKRRKKLEKDL